MTAARWRRILPGQPYPPKGARVRILHRDDQGRPWIAMIGEFVGGGPIKGGPHDGQDVLDVIPDLDAPGLDDLAREEAREWHEAAAAGWPNGRRLWRIDTDTILQTRDEVTR